MKKLIRVCLFLAASVLAGSGSLLAQGVTTAAVSGSVTGADGAPVAGATVAAVHQPSGTRYGGFTRSDGRYTILGMRVGGPYQITVSALGYGTQSRENVTLSLGVTSAIDFQLSQAAVALQGITVTGAADPVFSPDHTGAATSVSREAIEVMPTISRTLDAITRLSPQAGGGGSFAGQDDRLNNITVDGSYFNNSFGLAGQPGERTGVAPISLDAIEQVQVNVAPFDVRQGNFVGAGVNTVTRSGTNRLSGSLYTFFRDKNLVGTRAGANEFDPGEFDYNQIGGWLSGPIIRDRLFFFVNLENEALTEPGTTFLANSGNQPVGGNVTRVRASSLDSLSTFLRDNFDYETGPYQGYDHETPATRFLAKLDFNLNTRNKFSLRYTHLDSKTDVLTSNSSSLGFGGRRSNSTGLNFQNSNYQILENIRSIVGEWNATIGSNMANNFIAGYTFQDESRDTRGGAFFPLVDIVEAGSVYTTFGFEPFTPNNELRYGSYQLQNNFSYFGDRHTLTFGLSAERYESENVFFPGSQSVYTYNSLEDFYTDARGYLANPNRATSPVTLREFEVRYNNIPGQDKPVQPLEVLYTGIYAQDEWALRDNFNVTLGARVDVPFFGDTGFDNPQVDAMTFRDERGNDVKYSTSKLPDANLLFSPRLGFNWDVFANASTQLRGGTGVFTGRPAYVWISNQIGENGILTGFIEERNTRGRPFNPDPNAYKPTQVTGQPAASYGLAFSDPGFRFPQIWRTNLAVDQRLPFDLIATGEFIYGRDVNGVYYINANLPAAQTAFSGVDARPRWTDNRINDNVTGAYVIKNQDEGYSWNLSGSLERPFSNGLYLKAGYGYGVARNTIDPGSIAAGSWNGNPQSGDPNNPGLGYSSNSPGHRLFGNVSYRLEYFDFGATTISLFAEARSGGNGSYTFSGDMNGDGASGNDLIYIHNDVSEMNFETFTASGKTFTAAQQAEAWDAFIKQDPYLSKHRGEYAERGAAFGPMFSFADLSLAQEVFRNFAGRRNALQLRMDVLNVGNLLNSDWGVGQFRTTSQPLTARGADSQGRARYRLRNIGPDLISDSYQASANVSDVYRIQFGVRYTFD